VNLSRFIKELIFILVTILFVLTDRYLISLIGKGGYSVFLFNALMSLGVAIYLFGKNKHIESINSLDTIKNSVATFRVLGGAIFILGFSANINSWVSGKWYYF